MEFTKEQLIEEAKQAVEGCRKMLRVSPDVEAHKISLCLAEITLASLCAKPVYFVEIEGDQDINAGRIEGKNRADLGLLPDGVNYLYAVPPSAERRG